MIYILIAIKLSSKIMEYYLWHETHEHNLPDQITLEKPVWFVKC